MAVSTVALAVIAALSLLVPSVAAQANACQGLTWRSPVNLGTIVVPVGTTCSWVWKDYLGHCVDGRSALPGFYSGLLNGEGTVWKFTFSKLGTFPYDCCQHLKQMAGTIKVVPVGQAPAPKCVPTCQGRCWGGDGCGGTCAKYPKHTTVACQKCCKKFNTNPASVSKCYTACKQM